MSKLKLVGCASGKKQFYYGLIQYTFNINEPLNSLRMKIPENIRRTNVKLKTYSVPLCDLMFENLVQIIGLKFILQIAEH